jgi:hypothetical protein
MKKLKKHRKNAEQNSGKKTKRGSKKKENNTKKVEK